MSIQKNIAFAVVIACFIGVSLCEEAQNNVEGTKGNCGEILTKSKVCEYEILKTFDKNKIKVLQTCDKKKTVTKFENF
jgi:hypothetical protein